MQPAGSGAGGGAGNGAGNGARNARNGAGPAFFAAAGSGDPT